MIFPSFLPLLYFLDQTLMLFRCFVVIDTDQQQIAGIVLERTAVPLFLYLRQRTDCITPFQSIVLIALMYSCETSLFGIVTVSSVLLYVR